MTTYLGKSCSFCLPRVPFVNCRQFMYLVISLLVLRAGYGIRLYQFLIIAYLFTFLMTWLIYCHNTFNTDKPQHDKTNKMAHAPSKDSYQHGHPPSLIRVFTVCSLRSQGPNASSCGQRKLWSNSGSCPHWSQSSLEALVILLVLSCCGLNVSKAVLLLCCFFIINVTICFFCLSSTFYSLSSGHLPGKRCPLDFPL